MNIIMNSKVTKRWLGLAVIIFISLGIVLGVANQKAGFHEDEYYSYYSSNYTQGWALPEGEWIAPERLLQELVVEQNQGFQYGLVKMIQSWDVHPPVYYWILHTVCSITPNVFSKWQGIGMNIVAYLISIIFFFKIMERLEKEKKDDILIYLVTACYAWSVGIVSGVMFIRMYMLLTCIMLVSVYLHVKAWQEKRMTDWRFLVPMGFMVYIGFLTQYYFLFYQFFMTLACCICLLVQKKAWKQPIIYGMNVVTWLFLACFTYPSALGHMFRGYRGTEATHNLLQLSNTIERLGFFGELLGKYLLQFGTFGILFLVIIGVLILIRQNGWKTGSRVLIQEECIIFWILGFTAVGYFCAVSKTALMLGDTSVRYILPIFPVILFLLVPITSFLMKEEKIGCQMRKLIYVLLLIIALTNVTSILQGNTLFLYKQEREWVDYAKEHTKVPTIYIYDKNNQWCLWKSANELLEYSQVLYVSNNDNKVIQDIKVQDAKELLVYMNIFGNTEEQLQRIRESNPHLSNYELVKEDKFCRLYLFQSDVVQ